MGWGEELMDVRWDEVGDLRVDSDTGVEEGDFSAGSFGFGERVAGVGLVEEDLALKIGGFDEVAVDEGESADSCPGEEGCGGCSCGPYSDDGDVGGGEELLAGGADAGEEDLAGVAVLIRDGVRDAAGCGWGGGVGAGRCGGVVRHDEGGSGFCQKAVLFRSIEKGPRCREPRTWCGSPASYQEMSQPVGWL